MNFTPQSYCELLGRPAPPGDNSHVLSLVDRALHLLDRSPAPREPNAALSVRQAASRLGVSTDTVRDLIAAKQLRASNIGSGKRKARWRITPADLDSFLANRKPLAAAPRQRKVVSNFKRY